MAGQPAWLLSDGRVVLEPDGAALATLAVEAVLRSDRRNGCAPGCNLVMLAAVFAAADPRLVDYLPEVHKCWSAVYAEAGSELAATPARFWLSAPEVARRCGATG